MAQIPTYEREFSFTGHSEDYPSRPHRGDKIDAEFDAVALALAATKTALAQIRRTDGQLKNLSVGLDQLKPEVVLGTPTDWTTATEYERKDVVWRNSVLYVCNTDHTSGTFATDLAAAYWTAYLDYADPLGDAADYANAARDYRDTAGGHAASAASSLSLAVAAREAAEAAQDAAEIAAQSITLPLDTSQGGTGALNITQARSNLSVYSIAEVDALFQSVDIKDDVVCATTANITLSGEQTIDGVLTSASRVLVKSQSSGAENGIYVSGAGAWTRASDFNSWAEVVGALVTVQQGTVNADRVYYCTNNAGGTLGTTAIVFDLRASSTTGLLAGLTPAADQIPYFTSGSAAALANSTAAGRTLWALANVAILTALAGINGPVTLPQGRLTLESGVACSTSDQTGKTTMYYTPAVGSVVPLWDGTRFVPTQFTELSQLTTDTTKSPAAVANNSVYDYFVWDDGGTLRCTRGPAWSSATARGTGAGTTELEVVQGVRLNKYAITNGPAANRGTWVGTARSNGSAQLTDSVAMRLVDNAYNRRVRQMRVLEGTDAWNHSTTGYRQANGSSANQLAIVRGLDEDAMFAKVCARVQHSAAAYVYPSVGIGIDSSTVNSATVWQRAPTNDGSGGPTGDPSAEYTGQPGLGYHELRWLEAGAGTGTQTWIGDAGGNDQCGIFGWVMA